MRVVSPPRKAGRRVAGVVWALLLPAAHAAAQGPDEPYQAAAGRVTLAGCG